MIKKVDENGNVRLITNIRKPRKWRRFEYLLSSGTLYIDIGYIPKGNFGIEVKFQLTRVNNFQTIWGSMPSSNQPTPRTGFHNFPQGLWMAGINNTSSFGTTDTNSVHTLKLVFSNGTETMILDGNQVYTYSPGVTALSSNNLSIGLFARNLNPISNYTAMKCYYFKVYENDTLVRDFVPAQYNGQYGMWDLVEDKFYPNKGTGSFTVGPEMKNYDEIYEVRKTSSLLPSGVELYDYILSSGTLRIDTGVVPDMTLDTYFKIETLNGAAKNSPIIGTRVGSSDPGRYFPIAYAEDSSTLLRTTLGNVNTAFNYTNGIFEGLFLPTLLTSTINGVVRSLTNNGFTKTENNTLQIFGTTGYGTTYYHTKAKVYYVKLVRNGQVLRNMLPCTYLGEPGMWDTVENKFYRNQGTGLFTLGNKITLKEYEYLLSSGTLWIDTGYKTSSLIVTYKWGAIDINTNSGNSLFGSESASSPKYSGILHGSKTSRGLWIGSSTGLGINYNSNDDNKHDWELNINLGTVSLHKDSNLIKSLSYSGQLQNTISIGIFCNNRMNLLSKLSLYYFLIYDNNILVRDFIPCSYNETPGLWDKVEWKFYANAGSGSFTLGPEKVSGSIYLHNHLTNLFNGFVGGGQMTLSNGILVGTGNNSDTYFRTKTTQAVNTTSYYLVGVYVEGYTSATAWTFYSPQSNSNAALRITRDGWNWGYVKFVLADSQPIWDDTTRTFSGPIPKITISDCRIYKIT